MVRAHKVAVCRLAGAGTLAFSVLLATTSVASASTWIAPLAPGSSGEAQAGYVSERVDNSCTATTTEQSCGTTNIMPSAGSSETVSVSNNGTAESSYALSASGCGSAALSDYQGTSTVAHGNFSASSYQSSGPKSGTSLQFDGSTTWLGTGGHAVPGPQTFTLLAWFRTSSSAGGGIIGFATALNPAYAAPNGHWDRMLWLDNAGRLWAMVNPTGGGGDYVSSGGNTYDDGNWHLAAFTDSSNGLYLYVDGNQVGSDTTSGQNGAQTSAGWWSLGAAQFDYINYAPSLSANDVGWFNGYMAGVAVLPTALSATDVSNLYSSSTLSAYTASVEADSPLHYWALQDPAPTGTSASAVTLPGQTAPFNDQSGDGDNAIPVGGVSTSSSGPIGGGSTAFDGSSGYLETGYAVNSQTFSLVAWFKSSTSSGGTIAGMTDSQSNSGQSHWDRMMWLDNSGKLVFGVYNGSTSEITSSSAYNNGGWHLAVAEIGSSGQELWVDGSEVASGSATSAENDSEYWHVGWGSESGTWGDQPATPYWNGSLAGVAIIPSQLSSAQISTLYTSSSFSAYTTNVNAVGPFAYWTLQDSSASYPDLGGGADNATAFGGVTTTGAGPLSASAAAAFDGSTGYAQTVGSYDWETYTAAGWFNTSSSSGGTIIGLSNAQGTSGQINWDRQIWVDNSGHVVFGVYPNGVREVASSSSYNDGHWHFVVAELGSQGQQLYVDGTRVGYTSSVTRAQGYAGYWHIGWDSEAYWTDPPSSYYFNGSLAGLAIFPTQLSSSQIAALYSASNFSTYSGTVINDGVTEYWPLTSQAGACTAALATVAITANGTTTCILPPLSPGTACPSVSSGGLPLADLTTVVAPTTVTVPAGGSATLTINVADNGVLPSPLSAVDVQLSATVTAADNAWQAGADYPNSQSQL